MTSLKTSIKTITYLSDIGCLEIQGASLRNYMGHLRQKLEQDPARPRHFITETGIGYRFML
ncbi:hypothetical protein TUM9812_36200 [Escherichia coli]|nr:hypothetical protein TUM9812_36200 [Escherichia coli]